MNTGTFGRLGVACCCALFLCGEAAAAETVFQSGESTVQLKVWHENGDIQFQHVNTRTWFIVDVIRRNCELLDAVLIKNTARSHTFTVDQEAYTQVDNLEITAYPVDEMGAGAPLYALSLKPEDYARGDMYEDADVFADAGYLSVFLGGEFAPYRVFDLRTGTFLFLSDDGRAAATLYPEGACEGGRYVAVNRFRPDIKKTSGREFVAAISYSSPAGPIQEAKIEATREAWSALKIPAGTELDLLTTLAVPGSHGKEYRHRVATGASDADTFNNVAIWVRLTREIGIEIPIANDRIDLDSATLPAGFTIAPIQ